MKLSDLLNDVTSLASKVTSVVAAVGGDTVITTPTTQTPTVPQSQQESTVTGSAPVTTLPPVAATATVPETELQKIEGYVQEAAPVLDLIPGAQSIVTLLTLSVQFVNAVEAIRAEFKTNKPEAWAQIESAFSSAVQAFEQIPKQ